MVLWVLLTVLISTPGFGGKVSLEDVARFLGSIPASVQFHGPGSNQEYFQTIEKALVDDRDRLFHLLVANCCRVAPDSRSFGTTAAKLLFQHYSERLDPETRVSAAAMLLEEDLFNGMQAPHEGHLQMTLRKGLRQAPGLVRQIEQRCRELPLDASLKLLDRAAFGKQLRMVLRLPLEELLMNSASAGGIRDAYRFLDALDPGGKPQAALLAGRISAGPGKGELSLPVRARAEMAKMLFTGNAPFDADIAREISQTEPRVFEILHDLHATPSVLTRLSRIEGTDPKLLERLMLSFERLAAESKLDASLRADFLEKILRLPGPAGRELLIRAIEVEPRLLPGLKAASRMKILISEASFEELLGASRLRAGMLPSAAQSYRPFDVITATFETLESPSRENVAALLKLPPLFRSFYETKPVATARMVSSYLDTLREQGKYSGEFQGIIRDLVVGIMADRPGHASIANEVGESFLEFVIQPGATPEPASLIRLAGWAHRGFGSPEAWLKLHDLLPEGPARTSILQSLLSLRAKRLNEASRAIVVVEGYSRYLDPPRVAELEKTKALLSALDPATERIYALLEQAPMSPAERKAILRGAEVPLEDVVFHRPSLLKASDLIPGDGGLGPDTIERALARFPAALLPHDPRHGRREMILAWRDTKWARAPIPGEVSLRRDCVSRMLEPTITGSPSGI